MILVKYKSIEIKWLSIGTYIYICRALFSTGLIFITDYFTLNWWELLHLKIQAKNYYMNFNQESDISSFELKVGIIFIVVAITLFLSKKKYERWYKNKYPKNLIAIKHQGLQPINFPDFNKKIAQHDFRDLTIHPFEINDIEFDANSDYQKALTNQKKIVQEINRIKNSNMNHELAYFGISRIPLSFGLGLMLSDTQAIHVFDYNRSGQKWNQLSHSWLKNRISRNTKFSIKESGVINAASNDMLITVSVSFNVNIKDCTDVLPHYYKSYELALPNINYGERDRLKTINQLNRLAEQFRSLLDMITTKRNINRIHLFYAGPNSLSFKLGTIYSEAIHPKIIVYNYNRNHTPCYSWALDVENFKIIDFRK
ncbi:SAVED domain-containing protein [Puteibacter caeruleilacunae]|nr:SAVED domain-containing protein [Puteibacter caeruleilacunae]